MDEMQITRRRFDTLVFLKYQRCTKCNRSTNPRSTNRPGLHSMSKCFQFRYATNSTLFFDNANAKSCIATRSTLNLVEFRICWKSQSLDQSTCRHVHDAVLHRNCGRIFQITYISKPIEKRLRLEDHNPASQRKLTANHSFCNFVSQR